MTSHFFRHWTEQPDEPIQVIELHLPATLDASEFDHLNESILAILDGQISARWIVDLAQVQYMGSSVLGLIVNLRQRIKAGGGKLVLCCLSPQLFQIFRHSSLERLFKIARSREDARSII